jgi:hypothetical protein
LTRKEEFTNKNDKPKQKVLKITSNAARKKNLPKKIPLKVTVEFALEIRIRINSECWIRTPDPHQPYINADPLP